MHYENGHEVAQQLAREVHQIAFSPTKAWTRRNSTEETYICELGGMIALKLHAVFDCSPDTVSFLLFSSFLSLSLLLFYPLLCVCPLHPLMVKLFFSFLFMMIIFLCIVCTAFLPLPFPVLLFMFLLDYIIVFNCLPDT